MSKKTNYKNKIFSYNNCKLENKNYSRKDFSKTLNTSVTFQNCIFEQTNFNFAMFKNCKFYNCVFSSIELHKVIFENTRFTNCNFDYILFNLCKLSGATFNECAENSVVKYPFENKYDIKHKDNDKKQYLLIANKSKENKYIRESNTILKKVNKRWPNEVKRKLKKIRKDDAKKLGMSRKQQLAENSRRKKLRLERHSQDYKESQKGNNRKMDKGILEFIMANYTLDEFNIGINYAVDIIDKPFSAFSVLMKYINEGIKVNNKKFYN